MYLFSFLSTGLIFFVLNVLFEDGRLYGAEDVICIPPLPPQKRQYKNMFQEELYTLYWSSDMEF